MGNDGGSKGAQATGNFNQMVFIPYKKHHWGSWSTNDGKVGCCTPWWDSLMNGCETVVCDCFNLVEAEVFQWISSQQANNWGYNTCNSYTQTSDFTSTQMLQTSLGSSWDWTTVLDS